MNRGAAKKSGISRGELLLLVPAANVAVLVAWLARSDGASAMPMIVTAALSGLSLVAYVILAALNRLKARKFE